MDNSKASITWIPDSHLDNIVTVMAVVNTMDGSEDINEDNNSLTAELSLIYLRKLISRLKNGFILAMSLLWMEVFQKTATEELCHTNGIWKWSGKEGGSHYPYISDSGNL